MADVPDYYYANQWADELGSAYTMMSSTSPGLAFDLAGASMASRDRTQMTTDILSSNVQPYQ